MTTLRTIVSDRAASRHAGMTLLELMIVVAIVGVLVSTAGFLYSRQMRKAKSMEVAAVFAELEIRQEQYHVENARFLATGDDETDYWPPEPSGPNVPTTVAPLPESWQELQLRLDRSALYCAYVAMAGRAGDSTGPAAQSFGMPETPDTDWYYLLAACDFDGRAGDSLYFASNVFSGIAVRDEGR